MQAVQTVFMFSGQGSQYFQMGRQLFDSNAVFRRWMSRLDQRVQDRTGASVLEILYSRDKGETFDHTPHSHPAIFMLEYSLAQCLQSEGLQPDLVLGASLGSFAAAAVAGCIAPEQALEAVIAQAAAFEATCRPGGMIAVLAEPSLLARRPLEEPWDLAAVNFASHFVLSAPQAHLDGISARLRDMGVAHQRLPVAYAYHSRWIDEAQPRFASCLAASPLGRGSLPVVCCQQAAALRTLPADFLWRVVRQPIRLRETIERLERQGVYRYIDVGPSGTMATFAKYALPPGSASSAHDILTPYGRDSGKLTALLAAAV